MEFSLDWSNGYTDIPDFIKILSFSQRDPDLNHAGCIDSDQKAVLMTYTVLLFVICSKDMPTELLNV